jgi:hypothetical protein
VATVLDANHPELWDNFLEPKLQHTCKKNFETVCQCNEEKINVMVGEKVITPDPVVLADGSKAFPPQIPNWKKFSEDHDDLTAEFIAFVAAKALEVPQIPGTPAHTRT